METEQSDPFTLRDVEATDLEIILRLNDAEVPAVSRVNIEEMQWFAEHAAYFRVALRGQYLAAFLIGMRPGTDYQSPNYQWFCNAYPDFGYIDRIAVSANARRHGLATRMYKDFKEQLPTKVTVMTCEVNIRPPNDSSMRFHERLGFRQVGSQTLDEGIKEVALLAWDLGVNHE
jgi:predicted GNAT superfamily acetyltransferase